jgi:thioredoxin-like negative regulator of GroEL
MIFIAEEKELVLKGDFILYFYASWMPFYNKMLTMLTKIEQKYKDKTFFCIDTDAFSPTCKRFSITNIPAILLFKENCEEKRISGVVLTSALKNIFQQIYGTK